MGSYYIPSNKLKGESRILYIFTVKSLIFTGVFGLVGLIFYAFFKLLALTTIGIGILALFSVTGYIIGTLRIPANRNTKISKNVGGDSIDQIIKDYILFRKKRGIYSYAIPREEKKEEIITNSNAGEQTILDKLNFMNLKGGK